MALNEFFAKAERERERRTRRERHGQGELRFFDNAPIRATGCVLPDHTLTDAECLLPHASVLDDAHRVWVRRLPGTALRRRGRLKVDADKGLLFIDEPSADLVPATTERDAIRPDLERDLGLSPRMRCLVQGELFATLLYGALCNTTWRHKATGTLWHCSWRSSGGIVAQLRCEGDYLDWYCSGGEGLVDDQVLAEIEALGWGLVEANPPE